jgi:hypothetical protein
MHAPWRLIPGFWTDYQLTGSYSSITDELATLHPEPDFQHFGAMKA